MKKSILLVFALFATLGTFAAVQFPDVDISDPGSIVAYLTTFIVLAATQVVKFAAPKLPGWTIMMVVTALSALVTYLTNLLAAPDMTWLAQFGLGLAATFVHQLSVQFSGSSSRK